MERKGGDYTAVDPPVPPSTTAKLCTGLRIPIEECKSGDYTAVDPPDPIPNSEVKYGKADGSP